MKSPQLPGKSQGAIAKAMAFWFEEQKRDLPWRKNRDPYSIWVSEVMLQQTQVATVVPYFQRFLKAFPNVTSLANASEERLMSFWQGLGYYRRARFLHQAAKIIHDHHGGIFPKDPATVAKLPGMGRYTCNAVLSQAFDLKLPILEANSKRVLARLFGWDKNTDDSAGSRFLWEKAQEVLPESGAGEFNQALMELGSLVCTPAAPSCSHCPLASFCRAKLTGRTGEIPLKKSRPKVTVIREVALAVHDKHGICLGKRPAGERWAGLWEVPHYSIGDQDDSHSSAVNFLRDLLPGKSMSPMNTGRIVYPVTRFRFIMEVFSVVSARDWHSGFYESIRRFSWKEAQEIALSSPQRKLVELLQV